MREQMAGQVFGDHRAAQPARLERRHLLVDRADLGTLGIVEHRVIERAGQAILGELRGGADVDDLVKFGALC